MAWKGTRIIERKILKGQIRTVNQSLFYLVLIILPVLLSFWSVLIQRGQLEELLVENSSKTAQPDVFPIKLSASALVVSALGFFFCLSLRACRDVARGNDPAAQKSAGMNCSQKKFSLISAVHGHNGKQT